MCEGVRMWRNVCAVCSGTGSKAHSLSRGGELKLEVEEVWQEVEQAGCIHTQLHLMVIIVSTPTSDCVDNGVWWTK